MSIRITLTATAGALMFLAACGSGKPAQHPVTKMAPFDLDCPYEEVRYKQIDDNNIGAVDCGKRARYVRLCREPPDCRWVRD